MFVQPSSDARAVIIRQIPVTTSEAETVSAVLAEPLKGVIPKGTLPTVEIDLPDYLDAPINTGDTLGEVRMIAAGQTVATARLVAGEAALRDDFPARWEMYWNNWYLAQ